MGNGHDVWDYIIDDSENECVIIYNDIITSDTKTAFITISGGKITLSGKKANQVSVLKSNWEYGTQIKFTPITSSDADEYSATAKCNNDLYGQVSVSKGNDFNSYNLSAYPNQGYAFQYWIKEGAEDIPENRITERFATVILTEDTTFIGCFREKYVFNVESNDESLGTVLVGDLGSSSETDTYLLTAVASDLSEFEKWVCGEAEFTENPLRVSVTENGLVYKAIFKPVELSLSLLENGVLVKSDSTDGYTESPYGGILSEGCRSHLIVPLSVSAKLNNASISLHIIDGSMKTVAEKNYTLDLNKGVTQLSVMLDPTKADMSTLTAEVTVTSQLGNTATATRTYGEFEVAASEYNYDYHFITSPSDGYSYKTIEQAGANFNGVYAHTDKTTKALSLYGYGPAGVYAWDKGGASVTRLAGLPTGDGKEVKALGPNGKDGLTAVVGDTTITLYTWNGEAWTAVEGSALAADASQQGTKVALVMAANDVWTDTRHWNGTAWESQSYGFASFERVSDTEAYGVDGSGNRWRYDGSAWTAAEAVNTPETASVTSTPVNGNAVALGQDQHGDWYLFVQARFHFIDDSGFYGYSGSDVYKWNGSRWVYQIMSDFNDPEDDPMETKQRIRPDGVNAISVPAPGVSVMYGTRARGGNGAIYLSADDVTISFDPGEGTLDNAALSTLTAPILSEIDSSKVPGASKTGSSFGGWYYDEACTVEFDPAEAAMPGESITLYAKYDEGAADLTYYKTKAKAELKKQYQKYSSADYTAENWNLLMQAYLDGIEAIDAATAGPAGEIDKNINDALNAAIAAMQAVPAKNTGEITVAVSMDANTLGLGYLVKPTLVTVDKNSLASALTEKVLTERGQTAYQITEPGLYSKLDVETMDTLYPWVVDTSQGWYLAQVYFPEQQNYKLPATIQEYVDGNLSAEAGFRDEDKNGKYLGEFDYTHDAGWLYSVGDKTEGNAAFAGVGASSWSLSDGEVLRWQFTIIGRGADVGNTYDGDALIAAADKSALTWEVATLRSKHSDTTLEANEVYADALAVLTNAEATQQQVNDALAALKGVIFEEPVEAPEVKGVAASSTVETLEGVTTVTMGSSKITLTATETAGVYEITSVVPVTNVGDVEAGCVVLVDNGDGTYTRKTVTTDAGTGVHTIEIAAGEKIIVGIKGDLNGDGSVTALEARKALAGSTNADKMTKLEYALADLDGNGTVSALEARVILAGSANPAKLPW